LKKDKTPASERLARTLYQSKIYHTEF
jgi:hypothetical protein